MLGDSRTKCVPLKSFLSTNRLRIARISEYMPHCEAVLRTQKQSHLTMGIRIRRGFCRHPCIPRITMPIKVFRRWSGWCLGRLHAVNTRDRASPKLTVPDGADFVPEEDELRSFGPVFRDEEAQGDRR